MANSKLPGLINVPSPWAPARTFGGHLGLNDQGDPTRLTLLGDTPGPLGLNDWADPNLPRWPLSPGLNFAQSVRSDTGVALSVPVGGAMGLMDDSLGRLITTEQLMKIFGTASRAYLNTVALELNRDLSKYCLDTVLRRAHFFAQIRQEGGPELSKKPESLNYKVTDLKVPFKYYRQHPDEALIDGYVRDPKTNKITQLSNQVAIANKAYAGKVDNGEAPSGDGWRFRGRGFMQITFRGNYRAFTRTYHKLYGDTSIDFEKNPDIVANFPFSLRSAVCFWVLHNLYKLADRGSDGSNVNQITEVVNFYTDERSYAARRGHFMKALNVFN